MKNSSKEDKKKNAINFAKALSFFKAKKNGRIPVPLGIFLLVVLAVLLAAVRKKGILFSNASQEIVPKNVKISNITDRSFVVSWVTAGLAEGMVRLDIDGGETIFRDVRDQPTGPLKKFFTHYVAVDKQIYPNRQYEFVIVSGNSDFRNNLYKIKTAQMIGGSLPEANLAFGQIRGKDGLPFGGGIVYLDIPGLSLLSSLTSSQGNWVIPLNVAFDLQLSQLADLSRGTAEEQISVDGGREGVATAVNFTNNNKPVPIITLGQNYDFRNSAGQNTDNASRTTVPRRGFSGTSLEVTPPPVEFRIANPSNEETVRTTRPQIFGVGPVGGRVEILVESEKVFKSDIKIGDDQKWSWTVPDNLSPGKHTLTVNYTSPQGVRKTIIKKFTVLAAGEDAGPAFTASSSATPSPTFAPSPTLVPTVTLIPTITVREIMPSTASGVPVTGFVVSQVFLLVASVAFLLISYLFFYVF